MKVANPEHRLDRFWGKVDDKHIKAIEPWTAGPTVLDLGCGYGTLTAALDSDPTKDAIGIDLSEVDLAVARGRHPQARFVMANAEQLPLENGQCDTVVMRDTLHHLLNEADWPKVSAEIARVSEPNSRLIIFDPNVQPLLRAARRLSRHRDEETTFEEALSAMRALGYEPIHHEFLTLFSLPLSGGYVGSELVPDWPWLQRFILACERGGERLVRRLGLGRALAWRYLIVGERRV